MDGEVMNIQKKTKLYVATKMQGLNKDQIKVRLEAIATFLGYDTDKVEFVNLLMEEETFNKKPIDCLALSLSKLSSADEVIIEKHEETRGVSCEEYICNKYKIAYKKVFIDWTEYSRDTTCPK